MEKNEQLNETETTEVTGGKMVQKVPGVNKVTTTCCSCGKEITINVAKPPMVGFPAPFCADCLKQQKENAEEINCLKQQKENTEEINSGELKNVVGGFNDGVPNPLPFKCPKCGKSFGMSEVRLGCGLYCKECQEKYPEELPMNDPKSPIYHLPTDGQLCETDSEKVVGGCLDEPHWKINNLCRKCGKQYEETCWSGQKVVTPGVCPECKEKERLEKQKINPK